MDNNIYVLLYCVVRHKLGCNYADCQLSVDTAGSGTTTAVVPDVATQKLEQCWQSQNGSRWNI